MAASEDDLRAALEQRFKGDRSGACIAAAVIENGTTARACFCANAKSERSIRHTECPRDAASTAAPSPVAPPPTMTRSKGPAWERSWSKAVSRFKFQVSGFTFRVRCDNLKPET